MILYSNKITLGAVLLQLHYFYALSSIKHIWNKIGRKVGMLLKTLMNLKQLRDALPVSWDDIPQDIIVHLIRSMPK